VDFSLEARFKVAQIIAGCTKCHVKCEVEGSICSTISKCNCGIPLLRHKSIRSQSIVFFGGDHNNILYEKLYLVDFAFSRPLGNQSAYTYDDDTERNLYRHPDRQGQPRATFTKIYDIYALGVVLLEVGLCQTAASIRDEARGRLDPAARALFVPENLMGAYVVLATSALPRSMGISYRDAVLTYLNGDFKSKANGSGFGMEFYQSVVQALDIKKLIRV
jgi:serine/threonine protein kinase